MSEGREEICPDCEAGPDNVDVRTIMARKDDLTGEYCAVITWHTKDCPQHAVDQVLLEDGVRRAKEQDAWAREALPAAFDRLRKAAAAARNDEAAAPFAAALVALVAQQAEDTGRFVPPHRWAEILDQYFPPASE
ncbi:MULTISPECIES: hypothetical protein [unclassified Streptomyces]|uniref:hypothetical protein n=1 Tax=unclassified Streptomyces TaxID=2593676 RepID=UPI004042F8AD